MGACPCGTVKITPSNYKTNLAPEEKMVPVRQKASNISLNLKYPVSFPGYAGNAFSETNPKNLIYDSYENLEFEKRMQHKAAPLSKENSIVLLKDVIRLKFKSFFGEMLLPVRLKPGRVNLRLESCDVGTTSSIRQKHPVNKIQIDRLMGRLSEETDYFVIDECSSLEIEGKSQFLFIRFNFFNAVYGVPCFETEISVSNAEECSVEDIEAEFNIPKISLNSTQYKENARRVELMLNKLRSSPRNYVDLYFRTDYEHFDLDKIYHRRANSLVLLDSRMMARFAFLKKELEGEGTIRRETRKKVNLLKEEGYLVKLVLAQNRDVKTILLNLLLESKRDKDSERLLFGGQYSKMACYFGENKRLSSFLLIIIK